MDKTTDTIFSSPKFEAISRELKYGPDFTIIDNDLYLFKGFKDILTDYSVYRSDAYLINWYKNIIADEYQKLNAPDWITWQSDPCNCAVIRLNNLEFFTEYLELFNKLTVTNLSTKLLERAIIKEQWSLGELFKKYNIQPTFVKSYKRAFHKGDIKPKLKPSHILCIQEYLVSWLAPKAYKIYKKLYNINKPTYDINWCFDTFLQPFERDGLLAPIGEKLRRCA